MLYAVKHKQIIFHIPPYEIYSVMHTDKGLIVTTFNVIQELNVIIILEFNFKACISLEWHNLTQHDKK